jgi:HAD superfamily hydrolase (TIGR01493 family)
MAAPRAFVFDAYGTLFDVHSIVEAARAITPDPQALSLLWRRSSSSTHGSGRPRSLRGLLR